MSPESSARLSELLNKLNSNQISSEEYAELQSLLVSISDLNDMPPLTQSGTISEAAMNQLLDGFSDTQQVLEEIQARVKADSSQRKRIIDKLLKIHAVINASKTRQAKLESNRQLIENGLNPLTKPEASIEVTVARASQNIAQALSTATNQPLDEVQQAEFAKATAMGLVQDQEDALLVISAIAPQTGTSLAQLNQEIDKSIHFLTESERITLLSDVDKLEQINNTQPLSENGFQVDVEHINQALDKHLPRVELEIDKYTAAIDKAAQLNPKLLDLPTQISQINQNINIALSNTINSGVFEKINTDNDLKAITKLIALQALKDNPDEVRYLSSKPDQIAALTTVSPAQGYAAQLQSKRISPQNSAASAYKLNLPSQPSFRLIMNQVRINRSSILKTELTSSKPTKFEAFINKSPFVRFTQPFQSFTYSFSNPSRALGNYFLKQIGEQTGKTFLKDFAHGLVAAENITARNLAGQLVSNVLKMGIKEGLKATASSAAGAAGGATAGGAIGVAGGPVGIILGIAAGFVLDKTIGLIGRGLNSVTRALTGEDFDWRAAAGAAVTLPLTGAALLSAGITTWVSTVSLVFISPILLSVILGVYVFFWIPTINIAPLLSTLVHLEAGNGLSGTSIGGTGIVAPPGEIPDSCPNGYPSAVTRITQGPNTGTHTINFSISIAGTSYGSQHQAIDFGANLGTIVTATHNGQAYYFNQGTAGNPGLGNHIVVIAQCQGVQFLTLYAHLQPLSQQGGPVSVTDGQLLAQSGQSGSLGDGPHLHYEIMSAGPAFNILDWVKR